MTYTGVLPPKGSSEWFYCQPTVKDGERERGSERDEEKEGAKEHSGVCTGVAMKAE